jgi:hypothetical protein
MGVSRGDTGLPERQDWCIAKGRLPSKQENIMKTVKFIAPWLAAAAIGGAIALAPVAAAATAAPSPAPAHAFDTGPDPLVPYGPNPRVPFRLGYINPNHDEGDFTNGQLDVPF